VPVVVVVLLAVVVTVPLDVLPVPGPPPLPDPPPREPLGPETVCVLDPPPGDPLLRFGLVPDPVLVDPLSPLVLGTDGVVRAGAGDPPPAGPAFWLSVVVTVSELDGWEA
jgi:hypothetical protein